MDKKRSDLVGHFGDDMGILRGDFPLVSGT